MRGCSEKPEGETSTVCQSCLKLCKVVKKCKKCQGGCYCSNECRSSHVSSKFHQDLCIPIQQLQEYELDKRVCSVRETVQVKKKNELIRLVGEKAVVNCVLGGVSESVLWDTGAMVSLVGKEWVESNFPKTC